MVHGKNRIPYRIDRRLTGLAGPDYDATISFGLPLESEDSRYGKYRLKVAGDGEEALAVLRKIGDYQDAARPDLILLDLNLPRKDGRECLAEIKADPELKRIPVVVLTTSQAEADIQRCYELHANCYITKPVDFDRFTNVVSAVEEFWLKVVELPIT